jgi:hypothetical protein
MSHAAPNIFSYFFKQSGQSSKLPSQIYTHYFLLHHLRICLSLALHLRHGLETSNVEKTENHGRTTSEYWRSRLEILLLWFKKESGL